VYNIHLLSVDVKYEMIKLDRRSVTRSINFGRKVGDNVEHLKRTTPFLIFIGSKNLVGTWRQSTRMRMNEKHTPGNLRMRAANVYANLPFLMTHRRTNIKRYIFVPCCWKVCLGCQYRIGAKIIFFIFPYAFHHF
jgi:hypothetical protein